MARRPKSQLQPWQTLSQQNLYDVQPFCYNSWRMHNCDIPGENQCPQFHKNVRSILGALTQIVKAMFRSILSLVYGPLAWHQTILDLDRLDPEDKISAESIVCLSFLRFWCLFVPKRWQKMLYCCKSWLCSSFRSSTRTRNTINLCHYTAMCGVFSATNKHQNLVRLGALYRILKSGMTMTLSYVTLFAV